MRALRERTRAGLLVLAVVPVLLAGCSGGDGGEAGSSSAPSTSSTASPSESTSPSESPSELPRAREVEAPEEGVCYRLTYTEALAPTARQDEVDCERAHTALTFAVDRLDTVEQGHLLAVDADRVRDQAAERCPAALDGFLGGTTEQRRLSMLRTVWFTPTVAQSDTGAEWYRCDVIAVGADEELADLGGDLRGILGRDDGAAYGMCGTAAPDDDAFQRVICSREHSWRAISVVDLGTGEYPGEDTVREAGQTPCEDAGRDAAADPLDFEWGYEWPTQEQWSEGQTFGRCWAPD